MIYAMSDIHGRYDLYREMLRVINFSSEDTIYLLGDYVDRGEQSFEVVLDIASRTNVVPLMGNHDFYAISVLSELSLNPESRWSPRMEQKIDNWWRNGGHKTYEQFWLFNEKKREYILSAMEKYKNYADIYVGERRFTMVHGGIANYRPDMPLDYYGINELTYCREDYRNPKFNEPGRFLVTGHTPTALINPVCRGRIFKNHDHIAIDCGAVFDLGLGCICLDNLEEFYVN